MPPGEVVPIPTRLLVVSMSNIPELTLKALVEEESVKAAEPELAVSAKAPVVMVKPLEAVRVLAEVIVPVLVVEILPEVVTASPLVAGERVVPLRLQ